MVNEIGDGAWPTCTAHNVEEDATPASNRFGPAATFSAVAGPAYAFSNALAKSVSPGDPVCARVAGVVGPSAVAAERMPATAANSPSTTPAVRAKTMAHVSSKICCDGSAGIDRGSVSGWPFGPTNGEIGGLGDPPPAMPARYCAIDVNQSVSVERFVPAIGIGLADRLVSIEKATGFGSAICAR